jgi:hypothetical protein
MRKRLGRVAWGLLLTAITVALWARFLVFPTTVAASGLDPSWMQALGYFYRTRAQAGTDYVFTYGPLGFFATQVHDGALYWQRYAWELVVKLAAAVTITAALTRLPDRGLTLLGAVLVLVLVPYHFDTIYLVTLLAAGALLIEGACLGRPWACAPVPLLALLAMTKFTYFLLALWAVVLAEAAARLRGYRGVLSAAPAYLAAAAVLWLWCGQHLAHLGDYCRNSWEVSAGYTDAMSGKGNTLDVGLAAVTLGLAVLSLASAAWRHRRALFPVMCLLLLGPGLFLGWKNGLVRHDDHALLFFGMALFVALLLTRFATAMPSTLPAVALGALLACSVGGTLLTAGRCRPNYFAWSIDETRENVAAALSPVKRQRELEAERVRRQEEWRLDRVRAVVGDASIDELSCEPGVVLLNGLNWRPRPVFQSYTAYTPALLRMNADYFRSAAAPDYVLLKLAAIDDRPAASEDSPALLEILRRYAPVTAEKPFILLQRVPDGKEAPPAEPEVVCRRTIRFDDDINLEELCGGYQLLSLRFAPSVAGRVWGALFKRDELHVELRTASGTTLRRRLVPALAREGFLINPWVDTTGDLVRLYGAKGGGRVVSFRVTPPSGDFEDAIEMTVSALPRLPCRVLPPAELDALTGH